MIFAIIFFVVGLVVLIKGADFLVSGASSLSLKLKISPIVIGLTIVAFGTSSPELLVSVTSALQGKTDLALGNVVGSNISNILVILGISSIIYPLKVQKNTVWKEIPMSFLAAIMMVILGIQTILDNPNNPLSTVFKSGQVGYLTFTNGLVLLAFFIVFMYYTFGIAKTEADNGSDIKEMSIPKSVVFMVLGLIGLGFGSTLLVDNAITLAQTFGLSDAFIGLTLVAFGTSLPELATSVQAALKKQVDLAVGNVVGSNIFNIFLILGITAMVKPIPVSGQSLIDIGVLFLATIFMFIALFVGVKHRLGRVEGIIMLVLYVSYIVYLLYRG